MTQPPALDPATLRRLYGTFPSGVVAVCGTGPDGHVGLAASSFTAVSMDPPLVAFCIQNDSTTWPRLATLPRLGISVLGAAHAGACRQLAAKGTDRFAGLAVTATPGGALFLDGASARLDCVVETLLPAGDHRIVLLRVEAADMVADHEPLVFHASGFRVLSAPTTLAG
jgi:flavin reductase (DIM6/NTAB) family NADH-FMN oxidoreductase RutF